METLIKNRFGLSAIATAKDDPEGVNFLLKHSQYDKSDLKNLGVNTLASIMLVAWHNHSLKRMNNPKNNEKINLFESSYNHIGLDEFISASGSMSLAYQ